MDLLEGGRKLIVFAHHKCVLDAVTEAVEVKVDYVDAADALAYTYMHPACIHAHCTIMHIHV